MTFLNYSIDSNWKSTLNKVFQQLRRVNFVTVPRNPLNDQYPRYSNETGEWEPTDLSVDLTSEVSGILPIANGGLGIGTSAFGAAYYALRVNSGATGVEWKGTDGAFAPGWASASGTGTFTGSGSYARSFRLGSLVLVPFYVAFSQATAATATVTMNLPYTAVATPGPGAVGQVFPLAYSGATGSTKYSEGLISIPSGSGTATFRRDSSSTTWPIAAGATNEIWGNFIYEAA